MLDWANRVALVSSAGAAFFVLLLYAPALEAPFLVPKFAALEIAAALGALALALQWCTTSPRWNRLVTTGALLVLGTTAASWIATVEARTGAPYALPALARWASLFGIACGASVVSRTEDGTRRVLGTATLAAAVVASVGLLQHLGALPIAIPVFSMPGSTFGNRNLAAEVMAMALPLGMPLVARGERREARIAASFALGLELVFLAATRARGAWLGAAVGLALVMWLERKRWRRQTLVFMATMAIVAVLVAMLPGRWSPHDAGDTKRYGGLSAVLEGSVDPRSPALRTRIGLWRRTLTMVRDHPWLGVGPGNWPVVFTEYAEPSAARDGVLSPTLAPRQAHDDLLERAAETGIPGVLALLLLVAGSILAVRRRLQTDEGRARSVVASAAGSLAALLVISLASFPLEMPGTITLAGLALGFIAADERQTSAPRRRGVAIAGILAASLLAVWTVTRAEVSVRSNLLFGAAERRIHRDAGATEVTALLDRSLALHAAFGPELREARIWLRDGHPAESIAASERALAIEPGSPNAWATLAAARLAAEDFPGAIAAATRALDHVHEYPLALDVRRHAEARSLDPLGAQRDLDQLIDLASHAEDTETRRSAQTLTHTR